MSQGRIRLINLPNTLTLVNLLAGCMALVLIFNPGYLIYVPICTLISLVADFFDGFAARWTDTKTDIGKQLDSLADMVSFGAVPGAILYTLLTFSYRAHSTSDSELMVIACSAPAFGVTLFSALRLAKFNIDVRQSDGFIGLATPACTIFIIGVLMVFLTNGLGLSQFIINPLVLYGMTALLSWLLIAEIPMFAFKFKGFGWQANQKQYLFIIASLVLLAAFKFAGLSLVIVAYVLTSVILSAMSRSSASSNNTVQ